MAKTNLNTRDWGPRQWPLSEVTLVSRVMVRVKMMS